VIFLKKLPAWVFDVRHAKGIHLKNVTLLLKENDFRPALIFNEVNGINLEKVTFLNDLQSLSNLNDMFYTLICPVHFQQ